MDKQLIPKLRFTEFNEDYQHYILNDVLNLLTDFESNGSFASVKENVTIYDAQNYAWYVRATDLENNSALSEVKYVDKRSYDFLRKTPLFGAELLITKRGEIGKVYFYQPAKNIKATVAPNMYLLKLNDLVDSKYVYYSFINASGNKKLKRINASTTIGALYKNDVKSIKITFPQLPEQQKIASFLADVDDKITKLTKKKTLLEQYKKGIMQKIFNQELRFKNDDGNEFSHWEEKKLGDICNYKNGGSFEQYVSNEGTFNLISLNSIDIKGNLKATHKKVTIDDNSLDKGDLIMVLSDVAHGYFLGLTDIIPNDSFVLNQRMGALKPKININRYFLKSFINFNQKYFKLMGQGSSQQNLSKGDILKFIVKQPVIEEQTKIANFLSDIDLKIEALNTKIENSKSFKKGLLQKMFV
jgi:type I restriction enzyme S subunit